jgi:hypothetical protein
MAWRIAGNQGGRHLNEQLLYVEQAGIQAMGCLGDRHA